LSAVQTIEPEAHRVTQISTRSVLPLGIGRNGLHRSFDSMVHVIPMRSSASASDVAWQFLDKVVKLHGFPKSIVSDRDPRFTSKFWRHLQRSSNTELLMSTAFHPQTDGATERANRTIGQILRSIIRADQKDWARKIPFELNYGFIPRFCELGDAGFIASSEGVRNFVEQARWNSVQGRPTRVYFHGKPSYPRAEVKEALSQVPRTLPSQICG